MDGQIQKEGLKPQRGGEELGQEHLWHLEAPIPSLGVQGLCHLPHRLSAKETLELMMGPVPRASPPRQAGAESICLPVLPVCHVPWCPLCSSPPSSIGTLR